MTTWRRSPPPAAGARRGGKRISPAALRRHDARRRPADRLRRRRPNEAAGRLLVRSRVRPARPADGRGGRRRGESLALSQAGAGRGRGGRCAATRREAPPRPAGLAARAARPEPPRAVPAVAVFGVRGRDRAGARARAKVRRPAEGAGAWPHRASADAVIARHRAGPPQRGDRGLSRRGPRPVLPRERAGRWRGRC